jgi:wyosine [tRNA(Phe)-imidazoG37] synthetase (radical SAM superfamily)
MKSVYGPVPSRRLGVSLGIDPICSTRGNKICTFDCVYCQLYGLGPAKHGIERSVFVETALIRRELEEAISRTKPEIITISGTGEPTLAENLGEIVFSDEAVREALHKIDHVVAKIDASNQSLFEQINRPPPGMKLDSLIESIKSFSQGYKGTMSLQMMFFDDNKVHASEMADVAKYIRTDEVHINTPTRPCPVKPLSERKLDEIKHIFIDSGLNAISIYDLEKPEVVPLNMKETLLRRPTL